MTTSDDEMLDLCGADETTTAAARSSLNRTKPAVDTTENSSSPNNSGDQQSINRKWVKQMKRRIREFVSNSSHIGSGDRASGSAGELNSCELSSTLVDSSSSSALSNSAATAAADRLLPHDLASRVNRNFGVRLDKCEPSSISPYIPVVIEICTRLIELHVNDEGLYRKVGQKQVVASLRSQLNNGVMQINITDINWNNPHAVVSLLKCFLNQLPDSLTTSRLYPEFIRVCRVEAHSMRLNLIKQLLSRLPRHNYETLKYLCAHLRRVATAYQHNKMTIKNLCIAFSQSIIRHNEANCETIKSDHLIQSQLMELILIYYDWLFDPSHIGEIPEEIKEPCEQHLFQQYCFHNLPLSYADMLANIIKSLKANRTSSAYFMSNNSPIVNKIVPKSPKSPQLSSEAAKNASSKSSLMRSAKSIGNMPRYKTSPSEYQKKDSPKVTVKSSMTKSQNHANKNTKQRSKSVDVRLRSLFCATSHSIDAKKNKPTSPPPILQKSSTQDDSRIIGGKNQRTSCLLRFTNPLKANSPTTRKSYDSLAWTQNNDVKQPAMKTTTSNTVDFKQLEKKHERERELLAEIMAKLELDLAQAKKELNEEDDLVRCSMLLSDGLKHKYQKAQYKTSSPTKFKSHTTTNQANSANNNNQASSSSTGRSTSSLSSSGVSPHTNVLVATTTKASKTTTTSLFLQSPQSSSSTSSSDDFVIVSPKLNRNRTTATVTNQGTKKYHSKKQSVKSATTTSSNMIIRRHTIALGTVDQESSSSTSPPNNGGYICKLKRLNEVSKRTEISRGLVTRRDQNRCRLTSKSATNLIYSVAGGQQIKSSPQQQAANTDEDEDQKAAVKKTILNLSPLSISASSVSSSSASAASANDIQPSNSNSSRSSLMSENNKAAAAVQKNLVTSLADEVGSVSKMSSATTPTTTITKQKFESLI